MTTTKWQGTFTAVITPFTEKGEVDRATLGRIVRWQVAGGVDGLAPCGTTGEGATLTPDEQREVVATVVQACEGRVPVLAGCGTNDTRRTVEAARAAAGEGADGLLVVSPYYNKPNRSGMIAHYEAVAAATRLPVVVYNVPGRTGQDLGAELILELAKIRGVVGVKEASGNLEQVADLVMRRSPGFAVLSGDDSLALAAVALGAEGVVSVVSNEAPEEMSAMIRAARESDLARARELHYRLLPLMRSNFCETNPVPVKAAMALLGLCSDRVRAPLGPPDPRSVERLRTSLAAAGLSRVDA
jgi:4-hydroxy-tetrahydrodipicolinate synthase